MVESKLVRSYRDLEVYQISFEGAVKIHEMTMRLPKCELYEEGSQIRRSAKSIPANIAEGKGVIAHHIEPYRDTPEAHIREEEIEYELEAGS